MDMPVADLHITVFSCAQPTPRYYRFHRVFQLSKLFCRRSKHFLGETGLAESLLIFKA
jgi:hypothetical protein